MPPRGVNSNLFVLHRKDTRGKDSLHCSDISLRPHGPMASFALEETADNVF